MYVRNSGVWLEKPATRDREQDAPTTFTSLVFKIDVVWLAIFVWQPNLIFDKTPVVL